jgi:hypothetical protein
MTGGEKKEFILQLNQDIVHFQVIRKGDVQRQMKEM